jgi:Lon protease-like protein
VRQYPALPVPNFVLFPGCTVSLQFGFPALQEQLELAYRTDGLIVVAHSMRTSKGWAPSEVGCLAQVRDIKNTAHGLQAKLAGIDRARILSHEERGGRLFWDCEPLPSKSWGRKKLPELTGLPDMVRSYRTKMPAELWLDVAAFHTPNLPIEEKLVLLAEPDPNRRYYQLLESTRQRKKEHRVSLN